MFTANPTRGRQLSRRHLSHARSGDGGLVLARCCTTPHHVDDEQYITRNPHVQAGLDLAGIVWAFENTEAANWHPLTWISHMLGIANYSA